MEYNLTLVLVQQSMLIQDVKALMTAMVFPRYFVVKRTFVITNPEPFVYLSVTQVSFSYPGTTNLQLPIVFPK